MNKHHKSHKSIVPGNSFSTKVVNKDINFALRMWNKKLKDSDILTQLKDKKEYLKPSVINRATKINAVYMQKIKDLHADD